jgi:nitroreductase
MSQKKYCFDPLNFEQLDENRMLANASSFYELMKRRRTVREYSDRAVPREIIENAIRTAGTAPSGANMQPWHFAVVSNPAIKKEIRIAAEAEEKELYSHRASREWLEALAPLGTDEHKPFLETAPYLIAIFLKKFTIDEDGNKLKNYYTTESIGIATGMLIAALHNAGLATLTHTPSPMGFLNSILDRPRFERPFLLLVVGYPADDAEVPAITKYSLEKISTFL